MGIAEISFQIAPFNAEELYYLFIDTKIFFHYQDLKCVQFFLFNLKLLHTLHFGGKVLLNIYIYTHTHTHKFVDSTPPTQVYN